MTTIISNFIPLISGRGAGGGGGGGTAGYRNYAVKSIASGLPIDDG